jgi:large subunit ribosomal protein L25
MSECIRAIQRHEKMTAARKNGFVPGVVFGSNPIRFQPVKFDEKRLKKLLYRAADAMLQVKINNEIKTCRIKQAEKDDITGKLMHISLQVINDKSSSQSVNVPIRFRGLEELQRKKLTLHITKSEILVRGQEKDLPSCLEVDVSGKRLGDKVTVADLDLGTLEAISDQDEILAIVTLTKYFKLVS